MKSCPECGIELQGVELIKLGARGRLIHACGVCIEPSPLVSLTSTMLTFAAGVLLAEVIGRPASAMELALAVVVGFISVFGFLLLGVAFGSLNAGSPSERAVGRYRFDMFTLAFIAIAIVCIALFLKHDA